MKVDPLLVDIWEQIVDFFQLGSPDLPLPPNQSFLDFGLNYDALFKGNLLKERRSVEILIKDPCARYTLA